MAIKEMKQNGANGGRPMFSVSAVTGDNLVMDLTRSDSEEHMFMRISSGYWITLDPEAARGVAMKLLELAMEIEHGDQ
jgi:hypothetical protein